MDKATGSRLKCEIERPNKKVKKVLEMKECVSDLNRDEIEVMLQLLLNRMCEIEPLENRCRCCQWSGGFCREVYRRKDLWWHDIEIE